MCACVSVSIRVRWDSLHVASCLLIMACCFITNRSIRLVWSPLHGTRPAVYGNADNRIWLSKPLVDIVGNLPHVTQAQRLPVHGACTCHHSMALLW